MLNAPSTLNKKHSLIIIVFIALKFIIQSTLIGAGYELHRDEFLHLDLANHPAWGYTSVSPATFILSYLIKLLGNSFFWIKFFPALFGALTILLVCKTIEELKGNTFALILGGTSVLLSVLLSLNTLYQPNSLDVLSWTTFYFVLIKYINTEHKKWLYFGAIVFALGFLNKYNIIFLIIGLLPALLISKQRILLKQKAFYIALVLGFILILPNLWWQYQNNFPVARHLKELSETQLVNVNRFDFLKSQIFYFFGSLLVLFAALISLLVYKPFKKYQLFFWSMLFTLIVFTYFKAKGYYAIGIYPIYFAFGAVFLAQLLTKTKWRLIYQTILLACPLSIFILSYNYSYPNKSPEFIIKNHEVYKKLGKLYWEDGKIHDIPQDYADMMSWKELAAKVDAAYGTLNTPEQSVVICDNYGQAAAINFYTKKKIKALSFNADYVYWFDLTPKYINLIRVKDHYDNDQEAKKTSPYFESYTLADSITNKYAREFNTKIYVFKGAKIDINKRLKKEIEAQKK